MQSCWAEKCWSDIAVEDREEHSMVKSGIAEYKSIDFL